MKDYPTSDLGFCPKCGKVRYATKKRAKEVARTVYPGHHLSPYRCGEMWHIGNLPASVIRGIADRATLRPTKRRTPKDRWPVKKQTEEEVE